MGNPAAVRMKKKEKRHKKETIRLAKKRAMAAVKK